MPGRPASERHVCATQAHTRPRNALRSPSIYIYSMPVMPHTCNLHCNVAHTHIMCLICHHAVYSHHLTILSPYLFLAQGGLVSVLGTLLCTWKGVCLLPYPLPSHVTSDAWMRQIGGHTHCAQPRSQSDHLCPVTLWRAQGRLKGGWGKTHTRGLLQHVSVMQ